MMKIKIKTKYRIMYTNEFKIGIKIGSQGPIEIPFLILRRVYGKTSVLVKKNN